MTHQALEQVLSRAERAKQEGDFTYFFAALLAAEALAKLVVLAVVASISDDKDRNQYRLEHALVRSDGLGDWGRVLDDALVGPASQYMILEAREEQTELTRLVKAGDWQYTCVSKIKEALNHLGLESEELPTKSDLRRWFRLFATLRNKTRAHGATQPDRAAVAAESILASVQEFSNNFRAFKRDWAFLHRNLSGKYRVSCLCGAGGAFDYLRKAADQTLPNGVYVYLNSPRRVKLLETSAELDDFFFANGGFTSKKYELLSYKSDNKRGGDVTSYMIPPGQLPPSATQGRGELVARGKCLTNAPEMLNDYVERHDLEDELRGLLLDDKRPIVTLLGRGGIGKTSLALKVIQGLYDNQRYDGVVWLSARDVDLELSGPKPVRPLVLSPDDMGRFYASLVLPDAIVRGKDFSGRAFMEQQLQASDIGRCLFVFDNFETTQNPLEMFTWIDTYIRLPNKALITTRLREFKGDYPVEVRGMRYAEAHQLVTRTAAALGVLGEIDKDYIDELVDKSEGHPYVIKILLGEVAKAGRKVSVPAVVAGSDDILLALFERTYAALSPCSQRAFLTLSAWNSPVPRIALEAVLVQSTAERAEVERGIDALLQYSLAEVYTAPDQQEFIALPLVASVFGKKKLNINPSKTAILADVEILRLLGPSRRDDLTLGLAKKMATLMGNIARRVDDGVAYKTYAPIVEMICRAYNPGWLLLARWHMEQRTAEGYALAKEELRRFLENDPAGMESADAWKALAHACYQTGDHLGELHAFVERAQLTSVAFYDLSSTANNLNQLLRQRSGELDHEQRRGLAQRLLKVMFERQSEATADDFSRMAWLAINSGQGDLARNCIKQGLELEPENFHLCKLADRFAGEDVP